MFVIYNEVVLDHLSNPRNAGELKDADGVGSIGSIAGGDKITIYIKVKENILTDVTFKTLGCGATTAAGSMITVIATGKTLEEAEKITNEEIVNKLGGLPLRKLKYTNSAANALHNAIFDYRRNIFETEKIMDELLKAYKYS